MSRRRFPDMPRIRLGQLAAILVVACACFVQAQSTAPSAGMLFAQNTADASGLRLASGPPQIKATGMHAFNFRGTTRDAFEAIAQQFGVVATFDTELPDRQITFVVPPMDFATAMRALTEQTGTFWVPVDVRTFFVAADTTANRRDYDPEIQKTVILPASETDDEMTETSRMIRDIAGLRRTELDLKDHTLTLRDTPQNVALAEALVREVEQPHGEFMLEVDLLQVDSNAARTLGITPPSSVPELSLNAGQISELEQAASAGTLEQTIQSVFGSLNPLANAGGASALLPPLIALGGGNTAFFLAQPPGATATALQTLSAVRQARRVMMRMEDGRAQTLFLGQKFPVTLSLLSESLLGAQSEIASTGVSASTFPRTDFPVGMSPVGVAVADFNRDGNLDLAVVNQGSDSISVLLGNGDGTFQPQATYATGKAPSAILAGNFTSSGNVDLAVTNEADNTISILLGNGDGSFRPAAEFPTGMGPVALVSGDFNDDGAADLAVANQMDNTVSILLGNGEGAFTRPLSVQTGQAPSGLAAADFNADGNLDLAVTNSGANTFSLLLGRGNGTFLARTDFQTGTTPAAVITADFNADGRADLAVANKADNTVSIFLGNGNGTFVAAPLVTTQTAPAALVAGNFNSDAFPDLVVANQSSDTVSVFLGIGNGEFSPPLSLPTENSPVGLATGEFINNTLLDLAVANQASNTVSVILNSAALPTNTSAPLTPYPGSQYVDLGLTVKAVPRVHPNGEVTLELQIENNSLAGTNVNGIPVLSNQTIQESVRLRENETSVVAGMMENNDSENVSGLPGLAQAGPASYAGGIHNNQVSDTELIIAVTPRLLRLPQLEDRTLYAGRGESTAPAPPAAPAPVAVPGAQPRPAGPVAAPGAQPGAAPENGPAPTPAAPAARVPPAATTPQPQPGTPQTQPPGQPPTGVQEPASPPAAEAPSQLPIAPGANGP